jgi:hypothetical protein
MNGDWVVVRRRLVRRDASLVRCRVQLDVKAARATKRTERDRIESTYTTPIHPKRNGFGVVERDPAAKSVA